MPKSYRPLPSSDRRKSPRKDNYVTGGSHTGLGTGCNNDRDAGGRHDEWRFCISFATDDVKSVLKRPRTFPVLHFDLAYVPNPWLHRFEGDGVKLCKGEVLVIRGSKLRSASTELEVNVIIGTQQPNITSPTVNQFLCHLKFSHPGLSRWTEDGLPMIVVKINGIYSDYEVTMCQFKQSILNKSFLVDTL
ncbi:hypothetical protein HPB51_022770 [Rhipicephalus microplus]|uniref:Uncharacterized protein n=1 Tax=Rhipicephalus microplus TaxID=6941 RepID=A0A9J6ECE6_RHIMP|nr:hypothetical protein HPB51_022770 [Rhipicephalus microplus]